MVKLEKNKAIALAAVLVVLAAIIAPYASTTGFAAVSCTGKPILSLSQNTIQTGSPVVARISGLNNCAGQEILIKKESCYGDAIGTLTCADSKCSNPVGFTIDSARQYMLYACIDRDGDGLYWKPGEATAAALQVVSLPDLKVKSIVVPKYITPNAPFNIDVALENAGVLAAGDVEYKAEIYREGGITPFKTVTNTGIGVAAPIISAKGEYKFKVPLALGSGSYVVKVTVDPTDSSKPLGRTNEWDESNNVLSLKFKVK